MRLGGATLTVAMGLLGVGCGGSEFEASGTGGGGASGGSAGSGGVAGSTATGGSGGGPVALSVVQATPTLLDGTAETPSTTMPAAPAAGNAIIVGLNCFSEVDNCTVPEGGVTDNQGNTYVRVMGSDSITSSTTHGVRGYIFIAENIAAASGPFTITVDPNGGLQNNQSVVWGAIEVAGLAAPPSLDQTGLSTATCCPSSTTVATEGATAQANELAVAVLTVRSNDDDVQIVPQDGWTQHQVNQNGQGVAPPHSMVSRILTEAQVVSHTWTHDPPTRGESAVIATFRGQGPN